MKTPTQDYRQPKQVSGTQKVIINEKETAETDELDPKFNRDDQSDSETNQDGLGTKQSLPSKLPLKWKSPL